MKALKVIVAIVGVVLFAAGVAAMLGNIGVVSQSDKLINYVIAAVCWVLGAWGFGWVTGLTRWRQQRRVERQKARNKPKYPPTGGGM